MKRSRDFAVDAGIADVDALAPVIGWHTTEPGNYGENAGRAMDLHDRIDPEASADQAQEQGRLQDTSNANWRQALCAGSSVLLLIGS